MSIPHDANESRLPDNNDIVLNPGRKFKVIDEAGRQVFNVMPNNMRDATNETRMPWRNVPAGTDTSNSCDLCYQWDNNELGCCTQFKGVFHHLENCRSINPRNFKFEDDSGNLDKEIMALMASKTCRDVNLTPLPASENYGFLKDGGLMQVGQFLTNGGERKPAYKKMCTAPNNMLIRCKYAKPEEYNLFCCLDKPGDGTYTKENDMGLKMSRCDLNESKKKLDNFESPCKERLVKACSDSEEDYRNLKENLTNWDHKLSGTPVFNCEEFFKKILASREDDKHEIFSELCLPENGKIDFSEESKRGRLCTAWVDSLKEYHNEDTSEKINEKLTNVCTDPYWPVTGKDDSNRKSICDDWVDTVSYRNPDWGKNLTFEQSGKIIRKLKEYCDANPSATVCAEVFPRLCRNYGIDASGNQLDDCKPPEAPVSPPPGSSSGGTSPGSSSGGTPPGSSSGGTPPGSSSGGTPPGNSSASQNPQSPYDPNFPGNTSNEENGGEEEEEPLSTWVWVLIIVGAIIALFLVVKLFRNTKRQSSGGRAYFQS